MSTITGYKEDTDGAWIAKDTLAELTYTLDWTEWLNQGQTIATVNYTENSRVNDAAPLVIESDGIDVTSTKTYAVISGGSANKVYIVTADITTDDGERDRRAFRIKVENRKA